MKNAMTVIIVLANLALLTFANSTHAATTTIDGVTWTYINVEGGISLSNGYRSVIDNSLTGAIQVPEYIDGIPVVEIGSDAFIGCSFSNIILPSSVKKIGDGAFYGCDRLASIEFPDSITEFGDSMFTKCSSLRMVKLPRYIKSIPDATFCDCWSLEELTLPDAYTSIGEHAFQHCYKLMTFEISSDVQIIGQGAFRGSPITITINNENLFFSVKDRVLYTKDMSKIYYCPCDQKIDAIPMSVREIGPSAFESCTNLIELILPSSVTNIGASAFYDCTSLTRIVLPQTLPILASYAFDGCSKLESLIVPEGVRTIESYALAGCTSLKYLSIPSSVEDISRMFAWSYYGAEVIQFKGPPPNGLVTISQQRITKIIYNQKFSDLWQVAVIDAGLTQAECGIEIDGENFLVPVSWADHFPSFQEQFGNDFSVALTKPTGKRDGTGNLMQVWQDYVAGTDPTDENDKFTVSITFNAGGKPQIAYSPKFDDETEAAKRKYTTYGKAKLNDNEWTEVAPGKETDYNFFKVTVEMQ